MKDTQLHELLQQMTTNEKAEQMSQVVSMLVQSHSETGKITGPIAAMDVAKEDMSKSGSILGASGAKTLKQIQKNYMERHRLNIPLLFMADVIHGYKTVFPVPLALGCSWDLSAVEKSAEIAAKEASAAGLHVTFSPMADLVRDPRWGRVMESTGEDPYLNSEFARAFVRGYQGEDLEQDTDRIAACVKHFAAYGASEGGRDYNTVDMSERQLREYYMPAYEAALEEGAEMVMTAFNTVDGIPATSNRHLMRTVLRNELKFNGVLISDWGAVQETVPHGVAANNREAALKSALAGVDIDMMTPCYKQHLTSLVDSGELSEAVLDEAVLRILQLKQKLGLFDHPYRGADEKREEQLILSDEHRTKARELAAKSSVLLKNDGVLPLNTTQRVALIGPFTDSTDLLGRWAIFGEPADVVTLKTGLTKQLTAVETAAGCDIESITDAQISEARKTADNADVIILALGEPSELSGEAGSKTDIRLSEAQMHLVRSMRELNKPIITILFNGRPLDLRGILDESDAIIEAWFPGTEGGHAVADLLTGAANPSGKLTMSFPYTVGQIPVYYNAFKTGRPKEDLDPNDRYASKYMDAPNEPLFPFGFGLSYSEFTYGDARLSSNDLQPGGSLELSVDVKNTSGITGEETVQMYIRDLVGEVVRPVLELKGFEKIRLEPGEAKIVTFSIHEDLLKYHHHDLAYKADSGDFIASVGTDSQTLQHLRFSYKTHSSVTETVLEERYT
ncbi:glycoside hydrolase family 3 N-terminal domain-containing protein [Salisediminibacterium halotolerans]|uniref:glycoside hydrolase family 3 N-terminal domain-containing protein n=1 Tax=Salisediminibacterium halotolerans TaxID=517425 RepID=UPI000EB31798|nr:glycoside hydrolase family 3 N-terminal domain-containing protein [Salisediminibacterium halotolerans]RLJ72308.1 beta-glucosidase [Actinophytocola xinjiangensis]RPE85522.1 beta-glucosidase [Salisediminibacterium halotolerans]TWG33477.1 beta-glucosidase [Salisediminibacterium halotolerans]GEL07928.1 beta-glucosidase [Salisediminibacterium halotolerans]